MLIFSIDKSFDKLNTVYMSNIYSHDSTDCFDSQEKRPFQLL